MSFWPARIPTKKYIHMYMQTYVHIDITLQTMFAGDLKVISTLCYIQNNVNRSWSHQERFGVCATVCGRTLAPDALCFARRGFGTDDDPKSVEHPLRTANPERPLLALSQPPDAPSENCWTLSSLWWFWPASPKIESFRWVDRCILANP